MFLVSGLGKLISHGFLAQLADYHLLPPTLVVVVAFALPWAEIGLAAMILSGWAVSTALAVGASLLCIFAVGVSVNLRRGRSIACGCRGSDATISWPLVATNLGLGASILIAETSQPAPVISTVLGREALSWSDAVAVTAALTLAGLASRAISQIRELRSKLMNTEELLSIMGSQR